MSVPSSPVLRAAARWLEHRHETSDTQLRALFRAHPEFADITPTQYSSAYQWLQANDLLADTLARDESRRAIFEAAIRGALWFTDADLLVPEPNSIPQDGLTAAEALDIGPVDAFAILRHCWGKVDTALRARIGSAGELALLNLLSRVTNLEVRHVAAESDGYGYDIAAALPGDFMHIEVKATTRRGRLSIYLSRNEFDTMRRDPRWLLIALRLGEDLEPIAAVTVDRAWLSRAIPIDQLGGRWESAKFDVPDYALTMGMAPICKRDDLSVPLILRGVPNWPGSQTDG